MLLLPPLRRNRTALPIHPPKPLGSSTTDPNPTHYILPRLLFTLDSTWTPDPNLNCLVASRHSRQRFSWLIKTAPLIVASHYFAAALHSKSLSTDSPSPIQFFDPRRRLSEHTCCSIQTYFPWPRPRSTLLRPSVSVNLPAPFLASSSTYGQSTPLALCVVDKPRCIHGQPASNRRVESILPHRRSLESHRCPH